MLGRLTPCLGSFRRSCGLSGALVARLWLDACGTFLLAFKHSTKPTGGTVASPWHCTSGHLHPDKPVFCGLSGCGLACSVRLSPAQKVVLSFLIVFSCFFLFLGLNFLFKSMGYIPLFCLFPGYLCLFRVISAFFRVCLPFSGCYSHYSALTACGRNG